MNLLRQMDEAFNGVAQKLDKDVARLTRDALRSLLKRYVDLVNCGDCGNWDPETEDEVKNARAVLALDDGMSNLVDIYTTRREKFVKERAEIRAQLRAELTSEPTTVKQFEAVMKQSGKKLSSTNVDLDIVASFFTEIADTTAKVYLRGAR